MPVTRKQQIAEVLYDLPTNKMSTELIRWVMSHLPEDDAKGAEATKPAGLLTFNHNEDLIEKALGFSAEEIKALSLKLQDSFPEGGERAAKSVVMENFYPKMTDKEKALIISYGVPGFMNESVKTMITTGMDLDEILDDTDMSPEQKSVMKAKIAMIKALIEKMGGRIGGIGL